MKLPILIRLLHYYASMMCVCLFAFYACSGFIATHAEWFIGGENPEWEARTHALPAAYVEDPESSGDFCKMLLPGVTAVSVVENDEYEQWLLVESPQRSIRCIVRADEQEVEELPLYRLPPEHTSQGDIAAYISARHGGKAVSFNADEEYHLFSFTLESVWAESAVLLLQEHGLYSVRRRPAHLIRSISDLHRGKHAGFWQTLIADLTAIVLFFVIISGAIIGIQMKKRRRHGIIGLSLSLMLMMILLLAR